MNPGALKQKIIIQRVESYIDKHHITKERVQDIKKISCMMNNLYGKEYWTAKEHGAENTVEFIIRYGACKDISVRDRIKYEDRLFNIISIDNIKYLNQFIKIKAMEVV